MEEQFIPYELALELKELGFNERCLNVWFVSTKEMSFKVGFVTLKNSELERTNNISAPTWQQTFDWFIETYNLFPEFTLWGDGIGYICLIKEIKQGEFLEVYSLEPVDMGLATYDIHKVRPVALKALIRIVKDRIK
jgi:hypothetical protein